MMKSLSILGCTGSIGRQSIAAAEHLGIPVKALTANRKIDMVEQQARKLKPEFIGIYDENAAKLLKIALADTDIRVGSGMESLIEAATLESIDCVVTAVSGSVGLKPTLAAIDAKKRIALANKETLVCAGEIVMPRAAEKGAEIVPVDSEHSAIFQCLMGRQKDELKKILLTGSGGPFRGFTREQLEDVTLEQTLKHPNWTMGAKITVDSASMMNKGFEVIEAKWLFDVEPERIEVLVHPQSIIHSAVEFEDTSVIAQMGRPDMRVPISLAFTYPERIDSGLESLDFTSLSALTFEKPDLNTFRCLGLAYEALAEGGSYPVALNGANEVLVAEFLKKNIRFIDIQNTLEEVMERHQGKKNIGLEEILEEDKKARAMAMEIIKGK